MLEELIAEAIGREREVAIAAAAMRYEFLTGEARVTRLSPSKRPAATRLSRLVPSWFPYRASRDSRLARTEGHSASMIE
jgi:hypothetical protein